MRRILNNLGTKIMDKRPAHGYSLKAELLTLDVLTRQEYNRVKDFLCLHTWSDSQVCNPVPLSLEARPAYAPELYQSRPGYPNNTICRYGRGRINDQRIYPLNREPLNFGEFVYAWQELNPCYVEVTQLAPVNINTAPEQILVALFQDLEGFFVMQTFTRSKTWMDKYDQINYQLHGFRDITNQIYRFSATYKGPGQPGQLGTIYKTPTHHPPDCNPHRQEDHHRPPLLHVAEV